MTNYARQAILVAEKLDVIDLMRFDYQPPMTQLKLFRLRRYIKPTLIVVGLAFIVIPLSSRQFNPNTKELDTIDQINVATNILNDDNNVLAEKSTNTARTLQLKLPFVTKPKQSENEVISVDANDVFQEEWKHITVKPGDSLFKIFQKHELSSTTLQNMVIANKKKGKLLSNLHPGQKLSLLITEQQELKELKVKLDQTKTLHVIKADNGYKFFEETKKLTKRVAFSSNVIKDSLYTAARSAGINDKLTMQLANIFGWDIDFALDIRANDSFKILYEEEYMDDEKVNTGNIIAAEFTNQGKTYKAVRYTDAAGRSGYFSPEGYSMQKAFIRTPVNFTRISSHFSLDRKHPILHRIRAHKGVDYAAPTGTPIKAAGDGKVAFIGNKGGWGKVVELQHGRKYSTLYAHLSKFNTQLRRGKTVRQGQIIGYVGKTGLATGPHLHYEFRVNGVHRNPLTVKLPKSSPVPNKFKRDFFTKTKKSLAILASQPNRTLVAKHD